MNSLYFVLSLALALAVHGLRDESVPPSTDSSVAGAAASINLCQLVQNPPAFRAFLNCLLRADDRFCSPAALDFKHRFHIIVITTCRGCTSDDIRNLKCFISILLRLYRQEYEQIKHKYDPSGRYWSQLLAFLGIHA